MLRDARINQIGEGANEVLASFIALAGLRGPGLQLQEMWEALHHPWSDLGKAWRIGMERIGAAVHAPAVKVRNAQLQSRADHIGGLIRRFSTEVDRVLIHYREEILDRQYVQQRIAGAAVGLYAGLCVLSRWDAELLNPPPAAGAGLSAADLYLRRSFRRVRRWLSELHENDDDLVTATADAALKSQTPRV
jgi:alkylation response protein AidB-like acyl-CoA dehydrogenase